MRERKQVRLDYELSEELDVKIEMHQKSVLLPFLFALMVDVVIEFGREGALSELLYADDLDLMSETMETVRRSTYQGDRVSAGGGVTLL